MKRAFVFIDHDMTIRHFVKSAAFADLERRFEVTYVVNVDPHPTGQWVNVDPSTLGFERLIITSIPRSRMGEWYKLYAPSVLANQRGTPNYIGRKRIMDEINGPLRTQYYEILSLPGIYQLYRKNFLRRMGEWKPMRELLEKERPDIIVYPSLLTGYFFNELLVLTPKLGIPFIVLMNSWDNPSQKAVVTGCPDRLVVWGEHTKRHAMEYMHMPESRIEVFGAAQFEIYRQPVLESRNELCSMFKLPVDNLPIVLYAGVSKAINETRHLMLIERAIESGRVPPCRIIYRPHPWRGSLVEGEENFYNAGFNHIFMDPFMEKYYRRIIEKSDNAFEMADYTITNKLLNLVAGSISSLSTIQLETVLIGKPTISFMPLTEMESRYGRNVIESQRLAHFQDLWKAPAVEICDDDSRLPEAIAKLLEQSADVNLSKAIREYGRTFVVLDGASYSERLADLSERLT